jgi:hypothetical protein
MSNITSNIAASLEIKEIPNEFKHANIEPKTKRGRKPKALTALVNINVLLT